MGQKNTSFSKQELQEYAQLTYLSERDVLQAYNKYYKIDPSKVSKGRISARIPCHRIRSNTNELKLNPFGDRICEIFSTEDETMSFEDYLDMYSAMSESANRLVLHILNCFPIKFIKNSTETDYLTLIKFIIFS